MPDLTQWQGCYNDGWTGLIVPEAFSHPAKFSLGLIRRIYGHAQAMGWVYPGDYVLDPFGGVALGGLPAISRGLHWIGVELEEKFVSLGKQNIALWNRQLKGWPNLGTARLIQGDSRQISAPLLGYGTSLIVSSPPFCDCLHQTEGGMLTPHQRADHGRDENKASVQARTYGHTPGNLANMKEGDVDCVIGSPPFVGSLSLDRPNAAERRRVARERGISNAEFISPIEMEKLGMRHEGDYGHSPGQLGSLKEGSFDAVVSSPPYETGGHHDGVFDTWGGQISKGKGGCSDWAKKEGGYGKTDGQVSGDTFWSASREIVQGCYDLLRDGGHAIWVCKDYVKAGRRVPFSDRWQALCESVGFKMVCRHQAMLVKSHGVQTTAKGDEEITTERKSFFRRLAEKKGSPRIDFEDILCMVK